MHNQKTLRDIFSGYAEDKVTIFLNRNALNHDFIPHSAIHRDKQINLLAQIIAPVLSGAKISNVFLYGKTGTGKTLVAKQVTNELRRQGSKVKVLYVNCKMKRVADTEYRLFAELSRLMGKTVPPTGLPTDHVYGIFYDAVEKQGGTVMLVLDEIDALVNKIGDEMLYNLTRANQTLEKSRISVLGISNNVSFLDSLDPRVKSTLSEEELIFPPYNAAQLKDILEQRAEEAFSPGALGPGVIEKCAALAAQEHGDARKALDLLRVASELAERKGEKRVLIDHVDRAEDKIDLDRVSEVIKAQPKQSQAVLAAIIRLSESGQKDIQTGDIFSHYENICSKAGFKTLTQRRVSDLISELDMLGIINAKVISKGRYGRTREISFNLSKDATSRIKKILGDGYLL